MNVPEEVPSRHDPSPGLSTCTAGLVLELESRHCCSPRHPISSAEQGSCPQSPRPLLLSLGCSLSQMLAGGGLSCPIIVSCGHERPSPGSPGQGAGSQRASVQGDHEPAVGSSRRLAGCGLCRDS